MPAVSAEFYAFKKHGAWRVFKLDIISESLHPDAEI
jgi:hypothetical protein